MTDKQVLQQALEALEGVLDKHEGLSTQFWSCSGGVYEAVACNEAIEALKAALSQQDELGNASKAEQLLASHDHSLRAELGRMKAALAPAPAAQPLTPDQVEACFPFDWQGEYYASWRQEVAIAFARLYSVTAPAAQPLTLDNAPLGTKAPAFNGGHWVRVERGWKWSTGATFPRPGGDWTGELVLPKAAPAAQPDARKVIEQMVKALEIAERHLAYVEITEAKAAGQKWLKENK